jgi:hypothetical protein
VYELPPNGQGRWRCCVSSSRTILRPWGTTRPATSIIL